MTFRNDTYTGGEHYWIRFHNGTHDVMKEGYSDNETVFTGTYAECVEWLCKQEAGNYEYDLGI